jgi:NTP pyrophosphatase (non-canonical NTP hydrolase)
MQSTPAPIQVTVSGSFNRHWGAIEEGIRAFQSAGVEVLSPRGGGPEIKNGFIYLQGEDGKPEDIESRHLNAIGRSDAMYVVTIGGYIGPSVALEIGYALAARVPVWSSEPLIEIPHRDLVQVGSIATVVAELRKSARLEKGYESDSLRDLQKYYRQTSIARGFDKETAENVLMLLVEEVGELAKALRARIGVSMHENDTSRKSVQLELADCFIYLLHMANQTGILYEAFLEKERLNAGKTWVKRSIERPVPTSR